MNQFLFAAARTNHPLRVLDDFLEHEQAVTQAKQYALMRFVGYVLEIGFNAATIITADAYKMAVGGVPRNSLLIMVPDPEFSSGLPRHMTLLRVTASAPTPLTKEIQQTYFELQKKSMPALDHFTQSELQWAALSTEILGMFYDAPDMPDAVEFSGDINSFVSAHNYRVYAPTPDLLELIVNALVPQQNRFPLGHLRLTECRLGPAAFAPTPSAAPGASPMAAIPIPVFVSADDFLGRRTAMFGKTRLGKSNVVKLIAAAILDATATTPRVGQLIFDINGEYANDNPFDGNYSLRSAYGSRCVVYALTPKTPTPSRPLKLNFYEQPDQSLRILSSLLDADNRLSSNYVKAFATIDLPPIAEIKAMTDHGERTRALRKVQIYWAILYKAGYVADMTRLAATIAPLTIDPVFNAALRTAVFGTTPPPPPRTMDELVRQLEMVAAYRRDNPTAPALTSASSGKPLFDADASALLDFLAPPAGRSGVSIIQAYRAYHDPKAGDFVTEILDLLDRGQTVILDLGNADPLLMAYFSDLLSHAVFRHQVTTFSANALGDRYIQVYFEEAHNLFPPNQDTTTIYSRFAKEGAKYHIGMVYSTQSPSTINKELLTQTENFVVGHLSSLDEVKALARLNVAYEHVAEDILQARTPGYMRMLTQSHRFVVSVQTRRFDTTVGAGPASASQTSSLPAANRSSLFQPDERHPFSTRNGGFDHEPVANDDNETTPF